MVYTPQMAILIGTIMINHGIWGYFSVGAGNVLLHQHGHFVNHAHHLTTTRASHPIPSGTCAFRYSKIPH